MAVHTLRDAQDLVLRLLDFSVDGRTGLVTRMLRRDAHETTSYWLQLGVAIGIATLGLAVGSVAVIIGAMLIAPLMGPIVGLAMGLASGSPFLVLRTSVRIVASIALALASAALVTLLLPFHELNAEITSRASPTVLDLVTAGFCALAGVYASLRPGSDTAATAAGTSIGISLVPPLCASGYGLGTGEWAVAGGAALLFLTNLAAIVAVGSVAFLVTGFNRVHTVGLEQDALREDPRSLTARLVRRLTGLFESKAGPALRFLMPFLLLATIYVPLRRALDEVAWQVRVREAVKEALEREEHEHEIVESRVRVERHAVDVLLVLLGSTDDAADVRSRVDAEIRQVAGVAPHVEVLAVPDADALSGLESTFMGLESTLYAMRTAPPPEPPAPSLPPPPEPEPEPSPSEELEHGLEHVRTAVLRPWPASTVGEPLAIDIDATQPTLRLEVTHLGDPLGPDAAEGLRRSLSEALERPVEVVDVAIPSRPLTRIDGDLWLVSQVTTGVQASAGLDEIHVCIVRPHPPKPRARDEARSAELAAALDELLARAPHRTTVEGDAWSVQFVRGDCPAGAME